MTQLSVLLFGATGNAVWLRRTVFENPAIRDLADETERAVRTESRS